MTVVIVIVPLLGNEVIVTVMIIMVIMIMVAMMPSV